MATAVTRGDMAPTDPAGLARRSAGANVVLVLLGLAALGSTIALLLPFVGPIVLAVALSITAHPVYERMGRRWPWLSPTLRAVLTDLAILTLVLVPLALLFWMALAQADTFRPVLARWMKASEAIHQGRLDDSLRGIRLLHEAMSREIGLSPAQAKAWLLGSAARGLDQLADWAAHAAAQAVQDAAVGIVLCPLITFFLLRDGPAYVDRLSDFLPLCAEDTEQLRERTREATIAILRGLFLTGLLEGAVATVGYALMGVPAAVLLGLLTGLASAVPVVGTSSVWVPVALVSVVSGRLVPGVLVLAWGTAMVLAIDNFAAPWLVGRRIRVSVLPLVFGILGGVSAFGLKGLLAGPLIVSIAPTIFELVRRRVFRLPERRADGS